MLHRIDYDVGGGIRGDAMLAQAIGSDSREVEEAITSSRLEGASAEGRLYSYLRPDSSVQRDTTQIAEHTRMPVEASRVHMTINAPPAAVWKALMTPATFKKFFFGSAVDTDWKVGSPITFRGEFKGKKYEDKGEVKTLDEGKRLAFTHWSPLSGMDDVPENYHIVAFELKPAGNGTEVTLSQTNQNDNEPLTDKNRAEYAKNWTMVLDGLKKAVES